MGPLPNIRYGDHQVCAAGIADTMGPSGRGQRATFMRCRDLNKHNKDEERMACGGKEDGRGHFSGQPVCDIRLQVRRPLFYSPGHQLHCPGTCTSDFTHYVLCWALISLTTKVIHGTPDLFGTRSELIHCVSSSQALVPQPVVQCCRRILGPKYLAFLNPATGFRPRQTDVPPKDAKRETSVPAILASRSQEALPLEGTKVTG